ncbi:MAG TPA: hypothetical protein PK813_07755 [Candidatus Hydrogenedens sp.]|nr:hypothetical protein [Candidatus Hydrogenedens sp.]
MKNEITRRRFIIGTSLSPLIGQNLFAQNDNELIPIVGEHDDLLGEDSISNGDLKREMPLGKIGNIEISRLIAGGNIISGIAHSRDLIYVSQLMKNYFNEGKILDTLALYEQNGINTAILRLDDLTLKIINRHWKENKGKIQWIAQIKPKKSDPYIDADIAIDNGAIGVYIQGQIGDDFVQKGDTKLLGKIVDHIRGKGVIGGIGAHSIDVIVACEKEKIIPDFYMKTFHSLDYWSAKPEESYDNKWDINPDETIKVMKNVKVPWIAFKVLAAGAIPPKKGFDFAFKNGADFMCVGIFDFQVKEDVEIAINTYKRNKDRARKWYA